MTTPESHRRGQVVLGVFILLLALFTVAQGVKSAQYERETQACIADKFRELSAALNARARLTERETSQNKALWLIYADAAGLVKEDPTEELKPKDRERLQRQLVAQLLEYKKVITEIEKERRENPLPPYPVGICQ
jgi:hypothetical protein